MTQRFRHPAQLCHNLTQFVSRIQLKIHLAREGVVPREQPLQLVVLELRAALQSIPKARPSFFELLAFLVREHHDRLFPAFGRPLGVSLPDTLSGLRIVFDSLAFSGVMEFIFVPGDPLKRK
jgi:hypothetical protein